MKKNIFAIIAVIVTLTTQSCRKVSGSGPVISRAYNETGFTSVNVGIDGDIYYTQDSVYKLEIHGQSNILDKIETKIVDGELQIQFTKFDNVWRHDRISVYVSCPNIYGLGINGPGKLYALQPITSTNMRLKVNGSGNITVSKYTGTSLSADVTGSGDIQVNGGKVKTEDLRISGSGKINLLGIVADDVTTNTSGSGDISVNATNTLNVRISGSGDVYYTGSPAVSSSISGSGKLKHL